MTREEQKREALVRMKMLKLHENIIREFKEEDKLNLSENGGMLYWLDDIQQEYVKEFESKYNAVVYHVIRTNTEFGELLAFLYVSDSEEEWGYDKGDLMDGCPIAYVKNLDPEGWSEFGVIEIKPQFGGLVRTA